MTDTWVSIDPSKSNDTGLAYWQGSALIGTKRLRKMGTKGKYKLGGDIIANRLLAYRRALYCQGIICRHMVIEEGFGGFPKTVACQGEERGYWHAIADAADCKVSVVNVNEWRRAIKEQCKVSWPTTRENKKRLAQKVVKDLYEIEVTEDEADAVLLGWAAIRLGHVI